MTSFEKIHKELCEYIDAKIPEVELDTRREIVVYAVSLFLLREGDVLHERDMEWRREMKRASQQRSMHKIIGREE